MWKRRWGRGDGEAGKRNWKWDRLACLANYLTTYNSNQADVLIEACSKLLYSFDLLKSFRLFNPWWCNYYEGLIGEMKKSHRWLKKKKRSSSNSPFSWQDYKLAQLQRRESTLIKTLQRWWMSKPSLKQHLENSPISEVTEIISRCGYKECANSGATLCLKILCIKAHWWGCWGVKLSSSKL